MLLVVWASLFIHSFIHKRFINKNCHHSKNTELQQFYIKIHIQASNRYFKKILKHKITQRSIAPDFIHTKKTLTSDNQPWHSHTQKCTPLRHTRPHKPKILPYTHPNTHTPHTTHPHTHPIPQTYFSQSTLPHQQHCEQT